MAIEIQGDGGTVVEVDGTNFQALRTSPRPIDHASGGHYRLSTRVAMLSTQAANGDLFAFRWTHATKLMVLQKLRLEIVQTGAHTAAQPSQRIEAFIARSFTTFHTTNAVALTMTTHNAKKRTSHATSLIGNIAGSNNAAGMTGETFTLDANPIMQLPFVIVATVPTASPVPSYKKELDFDAGDGVHPFVFAQNEGLVLLGPTTIFAGASGTADLIVDMAWAEVDAY